MGDSLSKGGRRVVLEGEGGHSERVTRVLLWRQARNHAPCEVPRTPFAGVVPKRVDSGPAEHVAVVFAREGGEDDVDGEGCGEEEPALVVFHEQDEDEHWGGSGGREGVQELGGSKRWCGGRHYFQHTRPRHSAHDTRPTQHATHTQVKGDARPTHTR